jgi:hypothetical protein
MNSVVATPRLMQATRPSFASSVIEYFSRAQSLTVSALLHAILILILGGTVLVQHVVETPDFAADPGGLVSNDPVVEKPPEDKPQLQPTDFSMAKAELSNVVAAPSAIAAVTTNNVATPTFNMASVATTMPAMKSDVLKTTSVPKVPTNGTGLSRDIAARIANFTAGWAKGGTASMSKPLRSREFIFTAYLAKYKGGDWDSTVRMEQGKIWAGSLPNLLYVIGKLSKKKINAEPQAEPLDLASDEIFVKKPPFIWFTGPRDFKLTDKEVENLGEYLRRGGCIWGDSSLPGQRSRFDIAFRREMLRLVPDPNQPWKPLPPSHPIFTHSWYPEIKAVAPGINYYDEPIYSLQGYGGEIAVLYTANDYGDMWQFGLDEKGEFDMSRDEKRRLIAINEEMWWRRNLYYRNIDQKAVFDTYKFGTNIIIHLLTRWEEKLRTVPRGADPTTN